MRLPSAISAAITSTISRRRIVISRPRSDLAQSRDRPLTRGNARSRATWHPDLAQCHPRLGCRREALPHHRDAGEHHALAPDAPSHHLRRHRLSRVGMRRSTPPRPPRLQRRTRPTRSPPRTHWAVVPARPPPRKGTHPLLSPPAPRSRLRRRTTVESARSGGVVTANWFARPASVGGGSYGRSQTPLLERQSLDPHGHRPVVDASSLFGRCRVCRQLFEYEGASTLLR